MKRLYFRCNGGHYFRAAAACPFDEIPSEVIQRVLLIEFGNESSAFDALIPERYIHRGREIAAHEVKLDLY